MVIYPPVAVKRTCMLFLTCTIWNARRRDSNLYFSPSRGHEPLARTHTDAGKTHSCPQTIWSSGNGICLRNKRACWIWMYRHVSDVIGLKTNLPHTGHHTRANREQGFPQLLQMEESNHAKSHKRDVFPQRDTLKGRTCGGCYSYMCMCVRIDPGHVHRIRLSWEICSKLDFKQYWACLMRWRSGVQVCSRKKGRRMVLPAWAILTHRIILQRSQFSVEMSSSGPLWWGKWEW